MMKLILFVLFWAIFSVQSKITTTKTLIKAGDPLTLECDKPAATWKLKETIIAHCHTCPSSRCNVAQDYMKRITVFCTRNKSVLHFISTQIGDKGSVRCPGSGSETFELLVGNSKIPTDSPIYIIVSCVIAVFVIIIIIGGIVYVKFRRSSKKKQSNNNPTNNLRSSEGPELTAESEYANIYDVPTSSGRPTGNEIAMSQHQTYENQSFFRDVTNTPIKEGHLDYEDLKT